MSETRKAAARRLATGWHETYAPFDQPGIDIGCGRDPLNMTFRRWDAIYGDGDAMTMTGIPDRSYHTVYASHLLEHIENYQEAIRNWWRILAPTGHLIIIVPHRDLYEKRLQPPSRWNPDHKWFWLPECENPPRALNFKQVLKDALPQATLVSFQVLQDGWVDVGPENHSPGEYSLEAILKKT